MTGLSVFMIFPGWIGWLRAPLSWPCIRRLSVGSKHASTDIESIFLSDQNSGLINCLKGLGLSVDACIDPTVIGGESNGFGLSVTSYRVRRVVIPSIGLTTLYYILNTISAARRAIPLLHRTPIKRQYMYYSNRLLGHHNLHLGYWFV